MNKIHPRVGVGEVLFGMSIPDLLNLGYSEDRDDFDETTRWRAFVRDAGKVCYVKDESVICIVCLSDAWLTDENLFDLQTDELERVLGAPDEVGEPVAVDEERTQIPREYFSLGLQVWIESGKVVSVFCNATY
jgi:hypothetical protein